MTFLKRDGEAFVQLFESYKAAIAQAPGCGGVMLVERPVEQGDWVGFSTVSRWRDVESLNAYRASALFGQVWPASKALFVCAPSATSYSRFL